MLPTSSTSPITANDPTVGCITTDAAGYVVTDTAGTVIVDTSSDNGLTATNLPGIAGQTLKVNLSSYSTGTLYTGSTGIASWGPILSDPLPEDATPKANLDLIQQAMTNPDQASTILNALAGIFALIGIKLTPQKDIVLGMSELNSLTIKADGTLLWRDMVIDLPEDVANAVTRCFEYMGEKIAERLEEPLVAEEQSGYSSWMTSPLTTSTSITGVGVPYWTVADPAPSSPSPYILSADPYVDSAIKAKPNPNPAEVRFSQISKKSMGKYLKNKVVNTLSRSRTPQKH